MGMDRDRLFGPHVTRVDEARRLELTNKVQRGFVQYGRNFESYTALLTSIYPVDDHHTTEDTFLALGSAFRTALGPRTGLARFGYAYAPLDEALARAVLDISSRPFFVGKFGFEGQMLGTLNTQMIHHGLDSWARAADVTLNVNVIEGQNDHHRAESAFKALALACKQACERVKGKEGEIISTKGVL